MNTTAITIGDAMPLDQMRIDASIPSTSSFSSEFSGSNDLTGITSTSLPTTMASQSIRSCAEWNFLFARLNHYFRDEDILQGSEHSSSELGFLIITAYLIVILFGTIGNILTIIAVLRNAQMRTVRNFFILNLALSDFFICTVTAPITLYTVLYVFWPFGTIACKVVGSLQGFNIFLSTFSIAAIALDRYVLVIFPTKRERQHNLSLLFFLLIWLISILLALPLFAASDLGRIFEEKSCGISLTICHEQNMPINKEVYTVGVLVIQYAFPLSSIVFAYSRIASRMSTRFTNQYSNNLQTTNSTTMNGTKNSIPITAVPSTQKTTRNSLPTNNANNTYDQLPQVATAQEQRRKSKADRYRRTNFLLFSIVIVFAVAWFPLNIFHLLNTFNLTSTFSVPTFALCHVIAICSACLNPVSYAFFNHNFRTEFVAIFERIGLIWIYLRLSGFTKSFKKSTGRQQKLSGCGNSSIGLEGGGSITKRAHNRDGGRESTHSSNSSMKRATKKTSILKHESNPNTIIAMPEQSQNCAIQSTPISSPKINSAIVNKTAIIQSTPSINNSSIIKILPEDEDFFTEIPC